MAEAKERTVKLVEEHWSLIETLALKLIEQEIVESHELSKIIGSKKSEDKIPESL